jgi:hypothetical protein
VAIGMIDWSGSTLIATRGSPGGGSEAYSVKMDAMTGMARNPQRLASSTSRLSSIRGSAARFVVAVGSSGFHLWKLPVDLESGRISGSMQPMPHSGGDQLMPSSSTDGRVLAYLQQTPSSEMHVRFNDTGRDSVLVAQRVRPKVSPDGTMVAYTNSFQSTSGGFSDGR